MRTVRKIEIRECLDSKHLLMRGFQHLQGSDGFEQGDARAIEALRNPGTRRATPVSGERRRNPNRRKKFRFRDTDLSSSLNWLILYAFALPFSVFGTAIVFFVGSLFPDHHSLVRRMGRGMKPPIPETGGTGSA
jgi:hypothetical protein